MPGDDRLLLAYDAGVKALAQQDTTLSNLRNRTTALLTTAGLAISFAAGIGLIKTDSSKGTIFPAWAAYTLLGLLVLIGGVSIFVLWPVKQFAFGPDSGIILDRFNRGDNSDSILEFVANEMTRVRPLNENRITLRMRAFEAGAVLLVAETGVLIGALAVH